MHTSTWQDTLVMLSTILHVLQVSPGVGFIGTVLEDATITAVTIPSAAGQMGFILSILSFHIRHFVLTLSMVR